ncbi:hypothetical protein AMAG_09648 [Allomyces macrogynus ATCC 38327]|uniref:Uncharacterized protein n=1 Tax=Allomyces macrogynus (strain ATCC 38327) TaxID=578462 RepID=A0A0L0ST38_ALLM3|nr:hypothetical protein AMAG_09648 [Allomyces macrogynus ATCC 38327]|eukprot:KNE65666.1 hypothetical protein AMAG_09648 [Allomyces macrogynus ATCC 38327]
MSSTTNTTTYGPNGTGYILKDRAQALAAYPHARRVNGLLFVSGTSSRNLDGTHVGVVEKPDGTYERDIKAQTRAVIKNIEAIIRESTGHGLESVVDLTVFLVDMKDYKGFNEVYNEFFDAHTGPSRTTVAVAELPSPKLLIEIKAIAACP